jgi:hypothetical protein
MVLRGRLARVPRAPHLQWRQPARLVHDDTTAEGAKTPEEEGAGRRYGGRGRGQPIDVVCDRRRRARSAGQHRELTVTPGQPDTPAHLRTGRPTRCANRPVTKLLASPVTVWNRRRCLLLAQRGQCPSDKPVGDHGGSSACSRRVSPIRGSHVSGMRSSKQRVADPYLTNPGQNRLP